MNLFNESHRIKIENGFSIAWDEMGHGQPLVLLHGIMANNRTWRHVAPLLSDRYRILLPDLPGHGNSDRPDASYSLAWYAKAMLAWLDELGVDTVHLCGHSFGGGVAQWMVLEDRARIQRLALVASGGLGKEVIFPLRLATFPVCGPVLAPSVIRAMIRLMLTFGQKTFGKNEPEEIDILVQQYKKPGSMRAFQRTVSAVINLNGQSMQTWQRIQEIDTLPPLATFWGSDDPIIPVSHGLAARQRIEDTTISIYPGCGHYPHLVHPFRFARELDDFLRDPERHNARFIA